MLCVRALMSFWTWFQYSTSNLINLLVHARHADLITPVFDHATRHLKDGDEGYWLLGIGHAKAKADTCGGSLHCWCYGVTVSRRGGGLYCGVSTDTCIEG
jgi:hypothetical protein